MNELKEYFHELEVVDFRMPNAPELTLSMTI